MKNKVIAGLLALFLGGIGIHKFYLGQTFKGVIYLLFFWTFIPAIIAFFEAIVLFSMSEEKFNQRYNPASNTVVNEPMKKCPFCAEEVKAEAVKCKHCGSTLELANNNEALR